MRTGDLGRFILERDAVRRAKEKGLPKPWTHDAILRRYRFCNIRREDDKVTRWIANEWRNVWNGDKDLWFLMAAARWVNWPDTLAKLGWAGVFWSDTKRLAEGLTLHWRPTKFIRVLQERAAAGEKVWTGAYMVATHGHTMDKAEFVATKLLTPMWEARKLIRPRPGDSLHQFSCRLSTSFGMGSGFMTGQVIADLKYASKDHLANASDWHTWAISGPGSRRGLNRVIGAAPDEPWNESDWHNTLRALQLMINDFLEKAGTAPLHAQDLQNCLCEFDKYERVRLGEGRPRSTYPGV